MAKPLLYINLSNSFDAIHPDDELSKAIPKAEGKISRSEAKAVHKELPKGGVWRTIRGHHVYIVNGKVAAGSLPWTNKKGEVKAKKATKEHLKAYQEHIDKEGAKATEEEKPKKPAKKTATKKTTKTKAPSKAAEFEAHMPQATEEVKSAKKAKKSAKASEEPKVAKKTKASTKKAAKESTTAKRLREAVKSRPLTVDEEKALHDHETNEAVKKEILNESKKRRQEQLASVKKESAERKKKVQAQKAKKEAEEKQALAKRKKQEKEMNVKKVAPKGGKKVKAPDMKRVEIAPNTSEDHKKAQERENTPFKEGHEQAQGKYAELLDKLNSEWEKGETAKLLKKEPNKRSAKDIERVAKELTEKFEPIAMQEAVKAAKRRGISLTPAKLYENNRQGKAITREHPEGKITEGSGLYGDIQQAARAAMYETFHSVLSGRQNPGTAIAPHVLTRIRTKVHRELYNLLNHMPAPHEMRPAIADLRRAENELGHKLGRTPTDEELAKHLDQNSEHFREKAPILDGEGKRIEDPVQRLKALRTYADQQTAGSIDKNVGDEGEKEISGAESLRDYSESPEEIAERKDRINRLRGEIPKALKELGMNDKELAVWTLKHSAEASGQNRTKRTDQEVADIINQEHKHLTGGKDISRQWVVKHYSSAAKKLSQALAAHQRGEDVPALKRLAALKSLMVQNMLRTVYLFDLMKALQTWGIDHTVLEERYTRNVIGEDVYEIQKSLAPYEAIGATILTDDGRVHARIVEVALPETNTLYKSFNDFLSDIKKSLFPHKGSSNAAINKKASEYVTKNKQRYKALAEQQHARIKKKGGNLTWSEQLQLEKGGVWITWGGKKILINADNGNILYDSKNEAHREDYNEGASEDKIEFHHEKEALAEHEEQREKDVREAWEKVKGGKDYKKDPEKEKEKFMKKNRGVHIDEEGNLHFTPDTEVNENNAHAIDHGIHAFKEQMEEMRHAWAHKVKVEGTNKDKVAGLKGEMLDKQAHRALDVYADLSEEEREKLDNLSVDERKKFLGEHFLSKEGVKDLLQKYHDGEASEEEVREFLGNLGSLAGRNKKMMTSFLASVKKHNPSEHMDKLAEDFGSKEWTRAREEASKSMLPEGKFMIGNPITGKTMVVHVKGGFEGGRGGRGGKYSPIVAEAFDPEGGTHEEINSWGQLGKALGYTGKDAHKLKETLVYHANTDPDKPFMKKISDEEYDKYRAKTKLGLQEKMLHKDFKVVRQDKNRTVYAQDMPDGTTNVISVDKDGYIEDPVMARLVKQKKPIKSVEDLHEVLKNAVGNRAWVTAHAGGDIHVGDALGHHIQLEYDGMGAPRVVGGKYDGYRFMDEKDIPKGAVDHYTGEPIKALFKNGKLVDRKFTQMNDVPIEVGNPVMYKEGDRWKKGRIHSEAEGGYKITDGKGNVVGVFKKDELRPAKVKGRTLSDSGQAVVRLAKDGTHRMNVSEVFKNPHEGKETLTRGERSEVRKLEKAKDLFAQALRKAKINTHAFDSEGNLRDQIELTDAAMNRLQKVLGKSKAGRELLKQFNSVYRNELEVHVPEHLRKDIEAEGVRVSKDGTARISVGKFEQLRNTLGGLSIDHKARDFLAEHFKRKDRTPKTVEELQKTYQPQNVDTSTEYGKHYKALFKPDSDLMKPGKGLYGTQLEGVSHLVERGRAIAGHGMGLGKTLTAITAHASYKAKQLANGEKPKKTLIVSPAGIMSDWGKDIGKNTTMKALYIGGSKLRKKDENGKYMRSENGRHMFGQDGTEQEAVSMKHFLKNMQSIGDEDHDFHVMSYDQFMRNREALANSGLYDNIIIDEIHAFKNQQGKRGQSLAETTDRFKNVWGMSGTPMENDPVEMWSLIDTVTGGKHELGTKKEFIDKFLIKDRNGKVVGIKPDKAQDLGDTLANIIQFRNGEDVRFNDGSKLEFPKIVGLSTEKDPNPQYDFLGDLIDRSRDQQTTEYYGTKRSTTDYDKETKTVTGNNGESYDIETYKPKNLPPAHQEIYNQYKELEAKYLPESKLHEMALDAARGFESGAKKQKKNYLTAVLKLQKFLNAPLAMKMYVPGGKNAIESELTDVQSEAPAKAGSGFKEYNPETGEGHYIIDEHGHKRYFESDGKGGFLKNEDGSPKLLPPLHHNNIKAQDMKEDLWRYLDRLAQENAERRKKGLPEMMPKVAVTSGYTTFGTDVVEGVLRDLQREHPELLRWAEKVRKQHGREMGIGRFTGDADDREDTKVGYRGAKDDYANNQGWLWGTVISPAGKEGVDFGNTHVLRHYDLSWNPQRQAQLTARGRRSDSWKAHKALDRDNSIRVVSSHMPGTIEDLIFNAQDAKMKGITQVVKQTREAEQSPRYGDSASGYATGRNFTVRKKQPKKEQVGGSAVKEPKIAASAEKALKLVILV